MATYCCRGCRHSLLRPSLKTGYQWVATGIFQALNINVARPDSHHSSEASDIYHYFLVDFQSQPPRPTGAHNQPTAGEPSLHRDSTKKSQPRRVEYTGWPQVQQEISTANLTDGLVHYDDVGAGKSTSAKQAGRTRRRASSPANQVEGAGHRKAPATKRPRRAPSPGVAPFEKVLTFDQEAGQGVPVSAPNPPHWRSPPVALPPSINHAPPSVILPYYKPPTASADYPPPQGTQASGHHPQGFPSAMPSAYHSMPSPYHPTFQGVPPHLAYNAGVLPTISFGTAPPLPPNSYNPVFVPQHPHPPPAAPFHYPPHPYGVLPP